MGVRFAERVQYIKPSAIRELLKLTQQPGVISFAGGLPAPESFPIDEMKRVSEMVLDEMGPAAMQYSTTEGVPALRSFIAKSTGAASGFCAWIAIFHRRWAREYIQT